MRKLRTILATALIVTCTTLGATGVSAATVTIGKTTVKAGYTVHWYQPSDGTGWTATNGKVQKATLVTTESGYSTKIGLMKGSTGTKSAVFVDSTNYTSKIINKSYESKLSTAAYKPYITNLSKVTMTVNSGGSFTIV